MEKENFFRHFIRRSKEDKFVTSLFILLILIQVIGCVIEFYSITTHQIGAKFVYDSLAPALMIIGAGLAFFLGIVIAGFSKTRGHVIVWAGIAVLIMLLMVGAVKIFYQFEDEKRFDQSMEVGQQVEALKLILSGQTITFNEYVELVIDKPFLTYYGLDPEIDGSPYGHFSYGCADIVYPLCEVNYGIGPEYQFRWNFNLETKELTPGNELTSELVQMAEE